MASLSRLARLGKETFSNSNAQKSLSERIGILIDYLQNFTLNDVIFDRKYIEDKGNYDEERDGSPVTYVPLWDDPEQVITMGVFILKHNRRIPLHDHPGMFGIIKVLHGHGTIVNYSQASSDPQPSVDLLKGVSLGEDSPTYPISIKCAKKEETVCVGPKDPPCLLTPSKSNIHEITALNGSLVFLDILSPPYELKYRTRECHYFKDFKGDGSMRYLVQINTPPEFWCDTTQYCGRHIDPCEDEDSV